eukprot:1161265-Pelagomonas_calceolata.AAC.14
MHASAWTHAGAHAHTGAYTYIGLHTRKSAHTQARTQTGVHTYTHPQAGTHRQAGTGRQAGRHTQAHSNTGHARAWSPPPPPHTHTSYDGLSCKGKGQGGALKCIAMREWTQLQCSRSFGLSRYSAISWPTGIQSLTELFPGSPFCKGALCTVPHQPTKSDASTCEGDFWRNTALQYSAT